MLLGLPFLAAGGFALRMLWGTVLAARAEGAGLEAMLRPALGASVAGLLVLAGASLVGVGIAGTWRAAAARRRRRRHPGQPWLWEFAWERHGGRDESRRELGNAIGFTTVVCAIGIPLLVGGSMGPMAIIPLVLVTIGLGWTGYEVARRRRWGRSRVRYGAFPMHPGGDVVLLLDGLSPAARALPLAATLHCVEERYEASGTGRGRKLEVTYWELWRADAAVAPGQETLGIPLPPGVPVSALGDRPARWWELELRAEVPGVDYHARFLVPVYASPGPARAG